MHLPREGRANPNFWIGEAGRTEAIAAAGGLTPPPVEQVLITSPAGPLDVRAADAARLIEALVRMVLPDPPTSGGLAVRFAIYVALVALVLALLTGRNAVRWAVAASLGGIGTLADHGTAGLAAGRRLARVVLAAADGATLLVAGLRVAHLVAVLAALVLMFRPRANAFSHDRMIVPAVTSASSGRR